MFSFKRCISGVFSFPTTLQASRWRDPSTITPRAAGCSSRNGFKKQTRSPTELLQPETCQSCSRDPAPGSSFPRTFLPDADGRKCLRPPRPRTAPSPGEERGAGEGPQPAFCLNKRFPLPLRKAAAGRGWRRVGFPSHCLPRSARRSRRRFHGEANGQEGLVLATKLNAGGRKNRG